MESIYSSERAPETSARHPVAQPLFVMNGSTANPYAVTAHYTPSRIPHFAGNMLIEALPPTKEGTELADALVSKPKIDPVQRTWSDTERLHMLSSLDNFMLPQEQHLRLCYSLDSMLRRGYVGREPRTPGHAAISQALYNMQHRVSPACRDGAKVLPLLTNAQLLLTPQVSTALLGISGMGKTTTVRRFCAHLPSVIFHPSTGLHQIPALHVELPADGANVKGLAMAIISQIEARLPGSDYVRTYTTGKLSEERMLLSAAYLMHLHSVGLLICDEVQNLCNAPRGSQVLMSQLTSLCNVLLIPVLFIGTNKAAKVLSADFRQARRSSGQGIAPWKRMVPVDDGGNGEWETFLKTLWEFQWVKNPVDLGVEFETQMYRASQGVIDLAIKYFYAAQARAMLDGTETITLPLLASVFEEEFGLMHPMLDALASNDPDRLQKFDDIAVLNWSEHVEQVQARIRARSSAAYSLTAENESTRITLISMLRVARYSTDDAEAAVDHAIAHGEGKALAELAPLAWAYLTSPKPVRNRASKSAPGKSRMQEVLDPTRFDEQPLDYRRATAHAAGSGSAVPELLAQFGMSVSTLDLLAA